MKLKKDIVYESLRKAIIAREYKPEEKLPVELEFSRQLGVGKITLRSALERLEKDGLISRFPGKGTFVNNNSNNKIKFIAILPNYDVNLSNSSHYIMPGLKLRAEQTDCILDTCSYEILRSNPIDSSVLNMQNANYKGAFLMGSSYLGTEPEVRILKKCNIPVVVPHGEEKCNNKGIMILKTDTRKAFAAGLKYLADCGHRIVGTIGSSQGNTLRGYSLEEYLDLQKSFYMKSSSEYIQKGVRCDNSIELAIQKLLALAQPPTAVICYSDFTAMRIYQYLNNKGIKIPNEISILGCCGYPGGNLFNPPLTTIDFMYEKIGIQAFDVMLDMCKNKKWNLPEVIETDFFIHKRKSVKNLNEKI